VPQARQLQSISKAKTPQNGENRPKTAVSVPGPESHRGQNSDFRGQ